MLLFSFLEIKFQNGAHLKKKRLVLTYFSHFVDTKEKTQKFLQHVSQLHTYTYIAYPIDFFALPILQKSRIYSRMFSFWCDP